MESESTNNIPILKIAWTRLAHLDSAATRRTRAFYQIRGRITWLSVLATLFAIITETLFRDSETLLGLVVKILFVTLPVLSSILAAFSTKFYSNGYWLIYRGGAEEIKREIYFYRTILQKNKTRRKYLEKRLAEIQRQLYRNLGGEFAFEPYDGPIPHNYDSNDPNSDPGFNDLNGEEYFRYRLENQLAWHNGKINKHKAERRRMTIFILAAGGLGSVLAAWGGGLSIWVAFTASITAALIGWQELRNIDSTIRNYSKVVLELTILHDYWHNLEPEERTTADFYKMVRGCEDVLWIQNLQFIKSQQEALKESDLEEEASLINQVIRDSVDSAHHTQKEMRDAVVNVTHETLVAAEEKIVEAFKESLGSLAEEASSEIVQHELEAMGRAVTRTAEAVVQRASSLTSSLAQVAEEYAHIDIGRDTTKEELNTILSRFPKTSEVKG